MFKDGSGDIIKKQLEQKIKLPDIKTIIRIVSEFLIEKFKHQTRMDGEYVKRVCSVVLQLFPSLNDGTGVVS